MVLQSFSFYSFEVNTIAEFLKNAGYKTIGIVSNLYIM
jgi:hypothetical protein